MAQPKLRVRASGFGGSGYVLPARRGDEFKWVKNADGDQVRARLVDGEIVVVPGVTTVLNSYGDHGGIVQWSVDQTAAYATANIDGLLSRTEEQGFGFLRFFHKRKPDFDDPSTDVRTWHSGVLDDLANLGTLIHDWIEANVMGEFEPDLVRDEQAQMAAEWLAFRNEHEVVPLATELTVFNMEDGYAGTLDAIWEIDGVAGLWDVKSARHTRDSHRAQIAALDAAEFAVIEGDDGWWSEIEIPDYSVTGVIHVRPDDWDAQGNFIPAFCRVEMVDNLDLHLRGFLGALEIKKVERELKRIEAERAKIDKKEEED